MWLRLYTEITDDPKLRRLKPQHRWLWVTLLCVAKESPRPGTLLITEGLPYTPEDLADKASIILDDVIEGLNVFEQLKMITCQDGVYSLINWDKRQFTSDSSANRVRRHREKKRGSQAQPNNDVPDEQTTVTCNVTVTPPDTETETEADTDKGKTHMRVLPSGHADEDTYTREFLTFWQHYPRTKEKRRAFKAWGARIRDGTSPQQMIKAAQNYAQECLQKGTEERYIKYAATFIGPNKPFEDYIHWQPEKTVKTQPRGYDTLRKMLAEEGEVLN